MTISKRLMSLALCVMMGMLFVACDGGGGGGGDGGGGGGGGGDPGSDDPGVPLTWVPGQSIGAANIGDSYSTIKGKLGEASEVRSTTGDNGTTWWTDYDAVGLSMPYEDTNEDGQLDDNDVVDGIFASGIEGAGATVIAYDHQGLTVGGPSTFEAAVAVLGNTTQPIAGVDVGGSVDSDGNGMVNWWHRGVSILFRENRIAILFVFAPIPNTSNEFGSSSEYKERLEVIEEYLKVHGAK